MILIWGKLHKTILLLCISNLIADRLKKTKINSCVKPSHLSISTPSSCRNNIAQTVDEAVQNVANRPRMVTQLCYPETLLSFLMQASQWQCLGDIARPSSCMPRRTASENHQINITTQWCKRERGEEFVGVSVALFLDVSSFLEHLQKTLYIFSNL